MKICGVLALALAAGFGYSVTFNDQFDTDNYVVVTEDLGEATHTTGLESVGNPGGAFVLRSFAGNIPANGTAISQGYVLNSTFVYDPSVSGAITNLSFSLENLTREAFGQSFSVSAFFADSLVIKQGSNLFFALSDIVTSPQPRVWNTYSKTGLTPADFFDLNVTGATPDFSATGEAMTFGFYARWNWTMPSPGLVGEQLYDNFSVSVNAVPEPISLFGGIALLGIVAKRRQK